MIQYVIKVAGKVLASRLRARSRSCEIAKEPQIMDSRKDAVAGCRRVRELLYLARIVCRKEGMAEGTLED